jgi:hypothetical protein
LASSGECFKVVGAEVIDVADLDVNEVGYVAVFVHAQIAYEAVYACVAVTFI